MKARFRNRVIVTSKLNLKKHIIVGISLSLLISIGTYLFFYFGNVERVKAATLATSTFSSASGTYTAITGGTVVSNSTTNDEQVFNEQNIGFTFNYEGTSYTKVSIATNGFIAMGSTVATSSTPISTGTGATNYIISALGGDLASQTGSELRTQTSGTSPNRIFTIQWKGYRYSGASGENYNFQIKLYETSNIVQIIYGSFTKNSTNRTVEVGLRGSSNSIYNNRTTTSNWASTTAGGSNSANNRFRDNVLPSSGLTYTFTPPNSDLTLSISASNTTPCIGPNLVYTVTVANNGPTAATSVNITSAVPSSLNYVSSSASTGAYTSGTGVWAISSLANGGTATLTITTTVKSGQSGGTITSNAALTSLTQNDYNTSNNTSSIAVNVLNNAPTITAIADVSTTYNSSTGSIAFTIGDSETAASSLTVSASSSNTTCVPNGNITLGGSGSSRTIQITPGINQAGTSDITVTVSDGTCSKSEAFTFTVSNQSYSTWQAANIVVGQANFTTISTTASQTVAYGSNCSAISSKGVLAVGSGLANRVLIWNTVPTSNGAAANVVIGQPNFTTITSGCTQSKFNNVYGVAFSPDGNKLIVSERSNNRILIYNSIPTTNGQNADVVIGQPNFTSLNAGTSSTQLDNPIEVMVTPDGKLLVVDLNNNRVLVYNKIPTTNNAAADVVIGQSSFTAKATGNGANQLNGPWNCSIAPDGRLLIADDDNNRVLVYNSVPTANNASASIVIGQSGFGASNAGTSSTRMSSPGVTVSPNGMLAIADYGNNRVLIYDEVPTTSGAAADAVLGQLNFTNNVEFNNGSNNAGSASANNMKEPYGINFDLNDRLFLNGRSMHRVMIFGQTPTSVSDLALSFSSNVSSPCMGAPVSYNINISNNGPSDATNVVVLSALPYGFTLQSSTASSGTYNSSGGSWSIPSITNGSTATLTLVGTVNTGQAGNTITTYASVRSYNQLDNNLTNNSSNANISVLSNTTPTISAIADQRVDPNVAISNLAFTISDAETSAGSLTISATSSNTTLVPGANVTLGGSAGSRTISVTPATDEVGSTNITITVSDGTCSSTKIFKVDVGNTWLGYTTDWNTASNWSSGVPDASLNAYVPTTPIGGNYPAVNNDVTVQNLTINANASISLGASRVLNVKGNYANNGTSYTGSGAIIFSGTSQQSIKGMISNFTLNNSSGAALSGDVISNGTITLTSGTLTVGANTLTIQNALAGTASNLSAGSTSSLVISGSGSGINIPCSISSLNNLTLNNSNGSTLQCNLTIGGAFTFTSGVLSLNGRTLTLNGTTSRTNGTLSGSGSSNLSIGGSGALGTLTFTTGAQTLNNLTINRSGSGSMILGTNLTVSNQLTLTSGVITTGSNILSVSNTATTAISGHNTTGYINGNLRRYVGLTGSYDLPVGTSSQYQAANINLLLSLGITYLDARFTSTHSGSTPNILLGSNSVDGLLNNGFWTITPNAVTLASYEVTFTARGHSNGETLAQQHTLIKRHDSSSAWESAGTYVLSWITGALNNPITVKRTAITTFSDYAVGTSSGGVLPVDLASFTGKIEDKVVKLNWKTTSEVNNDYFDVERSSDGYEFSKIGKVMGSGNTTDKKTYQFIDKNPLENKLYYRLKQVDINGKANYSFIITVENKLSTTGFSVELYPNPTRYNNIQVKIASPNQSGKVKISILSPDGKVIHAQSFEGAAIKDVITLTPPTQLGPKTYLINVQQDFRSVYKELMIIE